jgi:outer membrane receptor for ferrienterochelin and colicins
MYRRGKRISIICLFLLVSNFISAQSDSTRIDTVKTVNVGVEQAGVMFDANGASLKQILGQNELKKAACCTLSESFELSNTVEISNSDGVSGIRQIEMMGLNGKYALMTRDNIPQLGGLATLNGMNNIPGPMVSDVRLAKGTGSVTLGYEGITGGIDYGIKTADNAPKWDLNAYQNNQGRSEINIIHSHKINAKLNHTTYVHGGKQFFATDMNHDMFADMPLTSRIYVGNQLNYQGKKTEGQFGITFWNEQKQSGEVSHTDHTILSELPNVFRFNQHESKFDIFGKFGIMLNEKSESSFGNILNFTVHQNNSLLNSLIQRNYSGKEFKLSYSGLYQTNLSTKLTLKSGISSMINQIDESLIDTIGTNILQKFGEKQVGIFAELVLKLKKLSVVLGARQDYHNLYGYFFTPRVHSKYEFNKNNKLFIQAGMGRRTPYMLIENLPMFINNRTIKLDQHPGNLPYGLPQEVGFNAGLSYFKNFFFMNYPSTLTVDVFSTQFQNQTVVDRDYSLNQITIASRNNGFAGNTNSIHLEWTTHPIRRMEVKFAYRYVKNLQFLNQEFQIAPFQSVHRGLVVVGYKTRNKWYFDAVSQINGPKRIAYFSKTESKYSPSFIIVNAQIRKSFENGFEFYIGAENLGNVKQADPILMLHSSQKHTFDAAYSWAPANGVNYYGGIRMVLN